MNRLLADDLYATRTLHSSLPTWATKTHVPATSDERKMIMTRLATTLSLAALASLSFVVGCSAESSDGDSTTQNISAGTTSLVGDWEGDIVTGEQRVDHTFLIVQASGKAQVLALARASVLPSDALLAAKVSGSSTATKVSLVDGSATFQLALDADGSLKGTAAIGSATYPVSFKRAQMQTQDVNIVATECSGSKVLFLGYDSPIEAAYNAKIDAMIASQCHTITTTTSSTTVIRKPFLVASAYAATKDFLSIDIKDANPANYSGPVLASHTYDASGAEIDLTQSFFQTQEACDKLIQGYVTENTFDFTGGEGSIDPGTGAVTAAARSAIKFENGKIVVDAKLFSYSSSPDVNGFRFNDLNGQLADLPFKSIVSLGVIDPASPVGRYLAANPQAAH